MSKTTQAVNSDNNMTLTEKQIAVARDMMKYFGSKTVVSRTELLKFTAETYGKKSDSTFLTTDEKFKARGPHTNEPLWGQYQIPQIGAKGQILKTAAPKSAGTVKTDAPKVAGAAKAPKTLSMTPDAIRKRAAAATAKNKVAAKAESEAVSD